MSPHPSSAPSSPGPSPPALRFDAFQLDPVQRRLVRDGATVDLSPRYLDALILLASEPGRLITKDRFMDEVWKGVPVTDEALTQCIRTLRRALGDDAARPRFIETAPKHGYRFIAALDAAPSPAPPAPSSPAPPASPDSPASLPARADGRWSRFLARSLAGAAGGAGAGLIGGLAYGFALEALAPTGGGASVVAVMAGLTALVGLAGGLGVSAGMAAADLDADRPGPRGVLGGAAGGLVVGAITRLVGLDAFNLMFGQAPGQITGAFEGVALGAAVGLGAWWAVGARTALLAAVRGAACVGLAGLAIPLMGGRLMAGSLDSVGRRFAGSHLDLSALGALFGETGLGPVTHAVAGAFEGLVFGAVLVAALWAVDRRAG